MEYKEFNETVDSLRETYVVLVFEQDSDTLGLDLVEAKQFSNYEDANAYTIVEVPKGKYVQIIEVEQ